MGVEHDKVSVGGWERKGGKIRSDSHLDNSYF